MKRLLSGLLCVLLVLPFIGCSHGKEGPEGRLFRYTLEKEPAVLDPQIASDRSSLIVIENIFEGLVRLDADKKPKPGVAARWEANGDHTVFTFYLREDACWADGTPLVAEDFVFGFQRAVMPQTYSKTYEPLLCIQNAREVNAGIVGEEALGVRAADAHTLVVTLEYPFADFPARTAQAPFMPCSRAFFEQSGGKYGLEGDQVLTNGPFQLRKKSGWVHNSYVRLIKSEEYRGENAALPAGVVLTIGQPPADPVAAIEDDLLDAGPIGAEQLDAARDAGMQVLEYIDTTWGLCFNTADGVFGNPSVRLGLVQSIDRETALALLPKNCSATDDLIPPQTSFHGGQYRAAAGSVSLPAHDEQTAASLLAQGLAELDLKALPVVSVLCPDTYECRKLAGNLLAGWRASLGYYLNVEPLPLDELQRRLRAGNYRLAICPLRAEADGPVSFLSLFDGEGEQNISRFDSDWFRKLLTAAEEEQDKGAASALAAENYLLEEGVFVPFYNESRYYVLGKTVSGLILRPFDGGVDFTAAGKLE